MSNSQQSRTQKVPNDQYSKQTDDVSGKGYKDANSSSRQSQPQFSQTENWDRAANERSRSDTAKGGMRNEGENANVKTTDDQHEADQLQQQKNR